MLEEEGYIASFRKVQEAGRPVLRVGLKYDHEGEPIVAGLERVSRPGRRVYAKAEAIPSVLGGLGVSIVSTSKGHRDGQESPAVAPGRRSALQHLVRRVNPCLA